MLICTGVVKSGRRNVAYRITDGRMEREVSADYVRYALTHGTIQVDNLKITPDGEIRWKRK